MAFNRKYLLCSGDVSGKTADPTKSNLAPAQWTYAGTDANTVVRVEGYFNDASDLLRIGDIITYVRYNGADWNTTARTVTSVQQLVVLSNTGTVVDVSDGSSIGVNDSD
jgi:hypothetical protein